MKITDYTITIGSCNLLLPKEAGNYGKVGLQDRLGHPRDFIGLKTQTPTKFVWKKELISKNCLHHVLVIRYNPEFYQQVL
jgi:hypothetical protein